MKIIFHLLSMTFAHGNTTMSYLCKSTTTVAFYLYNENKTQGNVPIKEYVK